MFQNLSQKLTAIFDRLGKRGLLREEDVVQALREVRVALLEADVALPVVKSFLDEVKTKAIGQDVLNSVTPGQMVVKIVHDHLVSLLGTDAVEVNLATTPPAVILMAGLQGSGKTTVTGKLAYYLNHKRRKKVLVASTDIYRPAAREQLALLASQAGVDSLSIVQDEHPLTTAKRALQEGRLGAYDVLIVDTAGRLQLDEALMDEIAGLKDALNPIEILLCGDAMMGQEAANVAAAFHARLQLTGCVLTRLDGDARGGAALSMKAISGCPLKFVGVGEKIEQLEPFYPARMADRILGMGDVVSLVEKAMEVVSQEDAAVIEKRFMQGKFDFNDLDRQLQQMQKMGGMSGFMSMLPGIGKFADQLEGAGMNDGLLKRQQAIIRSMTLKERRDYRLLNASRKRRIAMGAGTTVQEVNRLVSNYLKMLDAMKRINKLGRKGFLRHGLKGLLGGPQHP
jgi:signal recognition particle subunit SRP54